MNKCLYCGEIVKNKYCNVSCQNKHQGSERANKKYGEFKTFDVKCEKCEKIFQVEEREKLFPKKEYYFCSRSCANSRNISTEIKGKIREKILNNKNNKNNKNSGKNKWYWIDFIINTHQCKNCKNYFIKKHKKQIFCSKSCSTTYVNNNTDRCKKGGLKRIENLKKKKENKNGFTYIYKLYFENDVYIGKSDNPENRYKKHLSESLRKNKTKKEKWIVSLLNNNNKPILEILEKVNYIEWQEKEIFWIDKLKDVYNLKNGTSGGEGSNGFKGKHHTEETKEKLRKYKLKKI